MSEINKLTDKKLRAIYGKDSEKDAMIADGRGLSIRVSKKGSISWAFTYREGGRGSKLHRMIIGAYPDMSLKQARDKRDEIRGLLAEGKDPKQERAIAAQVVTVRDALEYWVNEYAAYNRKNHEKCRETFNKHIYPYIGDVPVEKTDAKDWLGCFDRMKSETPVAAGNLLLNCKQALKYCAVRQYARCDVLNLLTVTDVGKKTRKVDRVLSDPELTDLFALMAGSRLSTYYQRLLILLMVFGARTQEVRLSRWDEWDLDNGVWTVPASNSKASVKIIRPIPERMLVWLRSVRDERDEFILGEYKAGPNVSTVCRLLWKKLNHHESWTAHDLRRTFSTRLNDLGQPPHVVEQLLGHIMGGVMAVYNRSQYINEKMTTLNVWLNELERLGLKLK